MPSNPNISGANAEPVATDWDSLVPKDAGGEQREQLKESRGWRKWVDKLTRGKLNFANLFKKPEQREIDEMNPTVLEIMRIGKDYERDKMSDEALQAKTEEFRQRLESGEDTVDSLLPEAFAVMREATDRVLGKKHYESQIIGGIALHQGK